MIPSCVAEITRSRVLIAFSASIAFRLPARTISCSRLCREETSANSADTKKALALTSARTMTIPSRIGEVEAGGAAAAGSTGMDPKVKGAGTRPGEHRHSHDTGQLPRKFALVLGLTAFFTLVEVAGGMLAHSLTLLADAGHMGTDVAALALALVGARIARRRDGSAQRFGNLRWEILAALLNGLALFVIGAGITLAAIDRFFSPRTDQRHAVRRRGRLPAWWSTSSRCRSCTATAATTSTPAASTSTFSATSSVRSVRSSRRW